MPVSLCVSSDEVLLAMPESDLLCWGAGWDKAHHSQHGVTVEIKVNENDDNSNNEVNEDTLDDEV